MLKKIILTPLLTIILAASIYSTERSATEEEADKITSACLQAFQCLLNPANAENLIQNIQLILNTTKNNVFFNWQIFIITYLAEKNIKLKDQDKKTALHHACASDKYLLFKIFLAFSNDVNQEDAYGDTPLYYAIKHQNTQMIIDLLKKRAHFNVSQKKLKKTALHYAAEVNNTDIMQSLIAYGADIESLDKWNRTPLHIAAEEGNVDAVKWLLNKGANINAIDQRKRTAYDCAIENDYSIAAEYIENFIGTTTHRYS